MTRHPLPALVKWWPQDAKEWLEEKASVIEAEHGCSREEADARAEKIVRKGWLTQ